MGDGSYPFEKSSEYYDVIYNAAGKNYEEEARRIHQIIRAKKVCKGEALLDVACGTGRHIQFLRKHYSCEGLDLQPKLLERARKRNPGVRFHCGNMLTFNLRKQFDAITCLFSAIGYLGGIRGLHRAIKNMARHLNPGGVLIVEPWLTPEKIVPGHIGALFVNEPKLKLARINTVQVRGRRSILQFH
jgi:ubiquinone/menaquinone biosynthesis C-methylase UbiE